ncbi:MAG: adenosine deaminase [Phaeodactylibacter sp.]|uniref:adenosine deaminase n=1 Tax=Phaeodactylibacter sp. TaxID=1940289 RepID=UPI0032EBB36B
MDYSSLPKVELHLHLDCSVSFSVARQLKPGLSLKAYEEEFIAPPKCKDLADFLKRAVKGFELLQSREALRLSTLDLLQQLERENVVYTEIRFAPLLHTQQGLAPEAVVETVLEALKEGQATYGLHANLILCTLRRFSAGQSMATARLAERYHGQGVAGFDIAGDEANYELAPHIPAFQYVHEKGVPATAHAGEARGPESVRESVQHLHLSRIGHGVRVTEDPWLMDEIRASGLHLEICPTSNIQTDIYPAMPDHAVHQLLQEGFPLSINTDGRTLVNVSLSEEYRRIGHAFHWSPDQYRATLEAAINAAFTTETIKAGLLSQIREAWGDGS